mgnify:CR=1 FL=1
MLANAATFEIRDVRLHVVDLDRAFGAGTFVRTHVLRPTWHFVAAADIEIEAIAVRA